MAQWQRAEWTGNLRKIFLGENPHGNKRNICHTFVALFHLTNRKWSYILYLIVITYDVNPRRTFIFNCATALMAWTLAPVTAIHASGGTFRSLDDLSYPMLAGQVNTQFRIRLASGQTLRLKLLKALLARPTPAVPGRRPPGDVGNEKFSLIFSGPKDQLIEPAIHQFEHGELGRFKMYVGQIGTRDPHAVRYETVFNRPPPASV